MSQDGFFATTRNCRPRIPADAAANARRKIRGYCGPPAIGKTTSSAISKPFGQRLASDFSVSGSNDPKSPSSSPGET